jgi:hypothetical protein
MQTADYWQLLFSDRFTGARNPARLPTTDAIPSNPLRPLSHSFYHLMLPAPATTSWGLLAYSSLLTVFLTRIDGIPASYFVVFESPVTREAGPTFEKIVPTLKPDLEGFSAIDRNTNSNIGCQPSYKVKKELPRFTL